MVKNVSKNMLCLVFFRIFIMLLLRYGIWTFDHWEERTIQISFKRLLWEWILKAFKLYENLTNYCPSHLAIFQKLWSFWSDGHITNLQDKYFFVSFEKTFPAETYANPLAVVFLVILSITSEKFIIAKVNLPSYSLLTQAFRGSERRSQNSSCFWGYLAHYFAYTQFQTKKKIFSQVTMQFLL